VLRYGRLAILGALRHGRLNVGVAVMGVSRSKGHARLAERVADYCATQQVFANLLLRNQKFTGK